MPSFSVYFPIKLLILLLIINNLVFFLNPFYVIKKPNVDAVPHFVMILR